MNKIFIVGLALLFLIQTSLYGQDKSVLAHGEWYKVAIEKPGVYKLDRNFLSDIGIETSTVDPRKIKIYGNHGGMLPQNNNAERPIDLVENAIQVIGENDGSFDEGDIVIFYADGPDSHAYDDEGNFSYQQNIYARKNYYYITVGGANGKRVTPVENHGNGFPKISAFDDFSHHELSLTNFLISGREWYGEKFDINTEYTIGFDVAGVVSGSDIKITSRVMAQSFAPSSFTIELNGIEIGEHQVDSIADFNQKKYRYSVKGKEDQRLFSINSALLSSPQKLELKYNYHKNGSGQSIGFLNWVNVEVKRQLRWYGEQTIFRSTASLNNAMSTFEISQTDSDVKVWNITEAGNPRVQLYNQNGNKTVFGAETALLQEYALFKVDNLNAPEFVETVENQNLRGLSTPDLLIVAYPDFESQARQLANFRQSHDGLTAQVVTTDQIYNEFSSGRQDVSAIRDYVKYLYDKSSGLKYLLLFGRGSYDYLDIIPNNTNYVPIYESRNSLHPLKTYGSDDYYGFLGDDEGEWWEDVDGDHTLDIGVGRLPVTSATEAADVVKKLINYSTDKKSYGAWRDRVTFVADDGDNNLHQSQSNELADFVDDTYQSFNSNKLFLDAYEQLSRPNGEVSPAASEALDEAIDEGSLIVNFTGHGGEVGWMQEQVLDLVMIREWSNIHKLPLFVTATCEFGRHDDPRRISGGELVVTNPKGGGIGIVSTCRPVNSSSNFALNTAFYNTVFNKNGGEYLRLGDIFRLTKNDESVNQVGNRNFALLGDPSLRLNYPEKKLKITDVTKNGVSMDTINALSKVVMKGQVLNSNDQLDNNFNGTVYATIYDKETSFTTLGNENAPFNYKAKENVIFRGTASIKAGLYELQFIVPKNISYQFDQGKVSLYAVNEEQSADANGAYFVTIGGSEVAPSNDVEGPDISIYLGDTLNTNYNDISSNTRMLIKLEDQSGINLTGYGIGNNIEAILDDSITYVLNDYYEANKDTYQKGWVNAPLENMTKGIHHLTIRAWDTYNNSNKATIIFNVLDPNKLSIAKVYNYPNPFQNNTSFAFEHNRAGEDLLVTLQILDRLGGVVQKFQFNIEDSSSSVNLGEWDGTNSYGKKLGAGLYLIEVTVRSYKDGATNNSYGRLVLIN